MTPRVPISWGELIDKIIILEIKVERLRAPAALANVAHELGLLRRVLAELAEAPPGLAVLHGELAAVNRRLWDIEDDIRRKEASAVVRCRVHRVGARGLSRQRRTQPDQAGDQ